MRRGLLGMSRYVATPILTKHRLFVWLPAVTLSDHQLVVIARDDDYTFGVLHSRVHEAWARGMGTQLREVESGFRYTPTTCFETFPFPRPTDAQREAVAEAARELDRLRNGCLNPPGLADADLAKRTLTNLYNARPTWLAQAHERLDAAVLAATTPAPPGSRRLTSASTPPSWPPTAGRPTYRRKTSSAACWISTSCAQSPRKSTRRADRAWSQRTAPRAMMASGVSTAWAPWRRRSSARQGQGGNRDRQRHPDREPIAPRDVQLTEVGAADAAVEAACIHCQGQPLSPSNRGHEHDE
jgi:hypothetical protein